MLSSLPRLIKTSQVGDLLILLGGHQIAPLGPGVSAAGRVRSKLATACGRHPATPATPDCCRCNQSLVSCLTEGVHSKRELIVNTMNLQWPGNFAAKTASMRREDHK